MKTVKKFAVFMESEGSLSLPRKSTITHYPEPAESGSRLHSISLSPVLILYSHLY